MTTIADNETTPHRASLVVAQNRVKEARTGDGTALSAALTDLALALLHVGDPSRAQAVLEEAATVAQQAGDRSREVDAIDNLGLLMVQANRPLCAQQLFAYELQHARNLGDRIAEKSALGWLGVVQSRLGDHAGAVAWSEQALPLARALGDRLHEARILWQLAIDYDALGQPDDALARAEAAVGILRQMGSPEAGVLAEYVRRYRAGGGAEAPARLVFDRPFDVGAPVAPPAEAEATGPGLFRMALTALQSMAKLAAGGLRTVPPEVRQQRLSLCESCEHHTGLRCRACGCFTGAKARMPHEACPVGKWNEHRPASGPAGADASVSSPR